MSLNNLNRYGHPMLSNFKRFKDSEIVVPGGLICAASHAASSGQLYEVLHEEVVSCSFNHRVLLWRAIVFSVVLCVVRRCLQ